MLINVVHLKVGVAMDVDLVQCHLLGSILADNSREFVYYFI